MAAEVYTVRLAIFDTAALSALQVDQLYRAELERAGFVLPQSPAVLWPPTAVSVHENDPFAGARSITISAPPFEPVTQTRDTRVPYAEDPAKLADARAAQLTTFTWNVCGPAGQAGTLRELFRRVKPPGTLKLSPVIATWAAAPVELDGYPPKLARAVCERPRGAAGAGLALGLLALGGLLAFVARRG